MTKRKRIAIILTSGIMSLGFLFLLAFVLRDGGIGLDYWIVENTSKIRNENLTRIIKITTYLGQFVVLYVICLLVAFLVYKMKKDKKTSIFLVVNLVIASIVSTLIKYTVRRPRPIPTVISDVGFSFPSAHSMLGAALYFSLVVVAFRYIKSKWIRGVLAITSILLVMFIGFTRIYLGVHYFSDCLAGVFLAGAILPITYMLTNKNKI